MVDQHQLALGTFPIALVNVSTVATSSSRLLFRALLAHGMNVVPIRPGVSEIDGHRAYARVQDVPFQLHGAILMVAPRLIERFLDDCLEAGLSHVWVDRVSPHTSAHHAFRSLQVSAISIDSIIRRNRVRDTLRRFGEILHLTPS